ncbi:MAG TPA: translocation/assembly module TamB domain-containing protein [Steroidobacteraceae bacterium]|jgi:translocation and assembly module TamB
MRRPLKITLWSLASVASLLLISIGVLILAGNTDAGRRSIEKLTSRLTDGLVRLQGLNGSFPSHLTVDHLELTDARGVWLTADRIVLDWSPLRYFSTGLSIDNMQAARVDMERLPQSRPSPPGAKPAAMPHIQVTKFSCPEVKLGAELAGVPASLSLAGSADMQSITDMLFDAQARRVDGDGDYLAHLRFDRERMDAVFKIHEPASGPLEHILGLPGLGALDVDASFTGLRSKETLKLELAAGGLKGHAEGSLDLKELAANLRFDFDAPNMQPREDLSWSRAAIHGVWQGSLKSLNADAHVDIGDLLTPGGVRLKSLASEFTSRLGHANLKAKLEGLEIPGSSPRLLAADPIAIDADVRFDQSRWPVEITATHRLFALQGKVEAAAYPNATADLRVTDLAPLGSLIGQDIRGAAGINARLSSKAGETRIAAEANVQLKPGSQIWSGVVGDKVTLQLAGIITDKLMTVENFKFNGRAMTASLNGSLSRGTAPELKTRFDVAISDMGALASALAGKLSASGSVQGALDDLKASVEANSELAVRGSPAGKIEAKVEMEGLPRSPRGSIFAQGDLDGSPLHANVALERAAPGVLHTVIHDLNWKSARAAGDITTATASQTSQGHLEASLEHLSDLEHLIGSKIEGSAVAKIDLIPDHERTRMQLDLEGNDLKVGTLAGMVRLSGEGMTDAFPFKLEAKMPAFRGAAANLSSDGTLNLDAHEITVTHLLANYRGQDVTLKAPAHVLYANGVSVELLKFGAREAELEVQGAIYPDADLRIALSKVHPDLVNAFMPDLLAAGSIEAHAELHGSLASPTGQLDVHANGVRSAQGVALDLPAGNLRANAQLSGDTAQLDVALDAGSDSHLSISGTVPVAGDGAIDAKINGKVSVTLINPLLEARGQHAEGTLDVDANVTGTLNAPDIGGGAQLADGSVRDYVRGISLTNIEAKLTGAKGALQIETLKASAAPGTMNATGRIGVLEPDMPVDIKITAKDAQPVVSKLITANMNADIKISGNLRDQLNIAGNLHLNRALIGIPNSLPPNVAVLEVRRRGKAAPPPPDKPLIVALDLGIQAPRQVLVQGRGLDAEMGGDLRISGTTDSPQVSGRFDLVRGNFTISSSKLVFTSESYVSFDGAGLRNKLDPTLNFIATSTVNRGSGGPSRVTLNITGYADSPQFALTSDDTLPQDEIMAALLFGTNEQSLSALQLAQVGVALASLSGVGGNGGINPLAKIQKSLGLDRLSIGAGTTTAAPGGGTENSGASIEAGRYISKRVYIEAKQSTTGTSQLEADVDLTKRLKLQTKLGNGTASVQGTTPDNDPGSSIGLLYQFEY